MVKDILNSIDGLGLWGTLPILLFFMVFGWWLFSSLMMNKDYVQHMETLPFESNDNKEIH